MAKNAFEFGIIEICNTNNLIEREQFWLDCFDVVTGRLVRFAKDGTTMVLKRPPFVEN